MKDTFTTIREHNPTTFDEAVKKFLGAGYVFVTPPTLSSTRSYTWHVAYMYRPTKETEKLLA